MSRRATSNKLRGRKPAHGEESRGDSLRRTAAGPGSEFSKDSATHNDALAALIALLAGLAAAWIATGSVGLLAHPLRGALTWVTLIIAVLAVTPRCPRVHLFPLLACTAAAVVLLSLGTRPGHVFAVSLLLFGLAHALQGGPRTTLVLAAEVVLVLGLYRLAYLSIPLVWHAANTYGTSAGWLAGQITGHPLWVGATFAGLDYLIASGYLVVMAPLRLGGWTGWRSTTGRFLLWGPPAMLLVHLTFLCLMSYSAVWLNRLPEPPPPNPFPLPGAIPETSLGLQLRKVIPWNLPVMGALFHLLFVALLMFQMQRRFADRIDEPRKVSRRGSRGWPRPGVPVTATLLAALLPVLAVRSWQPASLAGRKIVFYEEGFLNWLKPQHGDYGRLSIGMYGMMPTYLESFGAQAVISPDLADDDLRGADAVVVIYPNETWQPGQRERLWDYVRSGGSLMVLGEHTVREEDGGNRFNDLLEPTAMRVRFDSSMFAVGGWLQSYDALTHPTTAGIDDTENDFGVVIGATVESRAPARPILVGRWGWADPGDPNAGEAKMGNGRYDAGEKLGDLVLAAEQPLGEGKVVVFGDTSNLSNGLTIGCHEYTSRLFSYLASDVPPATLGRQLGGMALMLTLLACICWQPWPLSLAAISLAAAGSLTICTHLVHQRQELLPDGHHRSPRKLAYIDAAHLGAYSRESWRDDGLMGLCLTLMRDDYLTLMAPDLTTERLSKARLLISVAPSRPFTGEEREAVREFVENGGLLICTVGHERSGPAASLLADFGFQIGYSSAAARELGKEPRPLGHFKSPYFNAGDYLNYVRFHAGWPVVCNDDDPLIVCFYPPNIPLIAISRYGLGLVTVVGDTSFAMNKNLEREGGEPIEGLRENAHFWRWLLALLEEGEPWYPPKPEPEVPPDMSFPPGFFRDPTQQESTP